MFDRLPVGWGPPAKSQEKLGRGADFLGQVANRVASPLQADW